MSDLFCAATLVLARPGDADGLAARLTDRRIAAVWSSAEPEAGRTAAVVAAALGVPVRVGSGLREVASGETDHDVVRRLAAEVESIADLHRGETVLVVGPHRTVAQAPRLTVNAPPDTADRPLGPGEGCELEVDADGIVLTSWAGVPVSRSRSAGTA